MTTSPSNSPSLNELFIKYLKFLKEIGIEELSLSKDSREFLEGKTLKSSPKNRNREKSSRMPAAALSLTRGVRLSQWSGVCDSRLICLSEKLSDTREQELADSKLHEIIEKGLELKLNEVVLCNVEVFTGAPAQVQDFYGELRRKIISAKPRAILAMGEVASSSLLGRKIDLPSERGSWGEFEGVRLMPTYHPDYILKNYTVRVRREVFDDIKKIKGELKLS